MFPWSEAPTPPELGVGGLITGSRPVCRFGPLRQRLQTVMQKYVGIVRSNSARLQKAAAAVAIIRQEAQPLFDGLPAVGRGTGAAQLIGSVVIDH